MKQVKNKRQALWFDYKIKKRVLSTILTSLFLLLCTSKSFALELRIGHFAPVGHPITKGTTKAAETIKKLSGGDITLKVMGLLPARGNMNHFLILSGPAPYLNSRLDSYIHLSTESLR